VQKAMGEVLNAIYEQDFLECSYGFQALNAKLRGHYQHYGRPTNSRSLWQFYRAVRRLWRKWLSRRTRGKEMPWTTYTELLRHHPLLLPWITHSWNCAGSRV